jgi:hypothetical protein
MLVLFMLYPTCNRFTFSEYFMYLKIWYHCHCISNSHQHYSSLSSWKSGYDPRPVFVGFMVDKVALGVVPIQSLLFSSHHYDSTNVPFSFISLQYISTVLLHCIQHAKMKETNAVGCGHVCSCIPSPSSTEPASQDRFWLPFRLCLL